MKVHLKTGYGSQTRASEQLIPAHRKIGANSLAAHNAGQIGTINAGIADVVTEHH